MTFTNSEVRDAREYLLECLSQGSVPKKAVFELAETLGVHRDALEAAKKELRIGTCKMDGQVYWCPPDNE